MSMMVKWAMFLMVFMTPAYMAGRGFLFGWVGMALGAMWAAWVAFVVRREEETK